MRALDENMFSYRFGSILTTTPTRAYVPYSQLRSPRIPESKLRGEKKSKVPNTPGAVLKKNKLSGLSARKTTGHQSLLNCRQRPRVCFNYKSTSSKSKGALSAVYLKIGDGCAQGYT